MDHPKLHVSLNTPEKPSRILALFALVFAFALPFILVKTFPHNKKTTYFNKSLTVPQANTNTTYSAHILRPTNANNKIVGTEIHSKTTLVQKNPSINNNPRPVIITRPGDTLTSVFIRLGLSVKTLQQILQDTSQTKLLSKIQTGQEIKFIIKNKQLVQMTLPLDTTKYLVIYRSHTKYKLKIHLRKTNNQYQFLTATVHGSLYNTAKRNNISSQLIHQMMDILTWDINFAKDIQDGDQFTIGYNALFIKDKQVGIGDILAVSYRNNGHTFQAVRHTNKAGHSDYFAPSGMSLKKAFNRYPVQFSHISSTFSLSRYHPILHYARPHKGVDLAARIGTPIHATADGRIEIIGRQGAYGNMIKIKHNKTYSTVYGHLLKFQKGLSRGSFVHLGQIIGYVGQSGLADGPHCHYEFHINNQPKNPSTVQLPRGFPLGGHELATFKANSNRLLAQIALFEQKKMLTNRTTPSKPAAIARFNGKKNTRLTKK